MMYEILYRFLIKYKKIDLPDIGVIALQRKPAESAFVDRSFLPPEYFFTLEKTKEAPSRKLFSWLATAFNITDREAIVQFNDFVFDLRKQLGEGKEIIWNGVGVLQKEPEGEIKFRSVRKELPCLEEISAEKVIRENAEHTMLVGETEKTSTEMTNILVNPVISKEKPNYWWVWPLAIIIAIIIFLGWYFSEHGIHSGSTGNNDKIHLKK